VSMIIWGLGSLWCSLAPDAVTLGYARLLLGFGMGMEFPVALAMASEFLPAGIRGLYMAILEGFWPLGFIAAGLLSLLLLQYFDWRAVFLAQAIPALFLFVIRLLVPESPRWLAARGRHAEADRVMSEIEAGVAANFGGAPLPEPRPLPLRALAGRHVSFVEIWSKTYAKRTVMIWLTWFFALLGFYGLTTWLGALLQDAGYSVSKSVTYTIWISSAGIPGFIASAILVERWGRKPTCVLMLLGSAVAAYLYGHSPSLTMLIAFGLAMQFFLFGMWSVLYAYTPELFPTRARATGAGCASAVGRLGSLLGPYLVGVILPSLGQEAVFALGAGSFLVAAMVVLTLGIETKGQQLEALSH
jgi:MFS transporter, putative metabolite:H+ symporter